MEVEEDGHHDGDDAIEHEGHLDDDVLHEQLLVLVLRLKVVGIERPLDTLKPRNKHSDEDEIGEDFDVDKEQDEEFPVPKADAIVEKVAMVVKIKHAPVALAAVMAAIRLEQVAH